MKRLLCLLALTMLTAAPQTGAQATGIHVSPLKAEHTAQPGSIVVSHILLKNTANQPVTVRVSAQDFAASPVLDGEPKLQPEGNPTFGLANWLTDANLEKTLTIPANQLIEYSATFRVPRTAQERTYFGTVLFTTTHGQPVSVGSLVFITVGNPKTILSVDSLTYGESSEASKRFGVFTATIENKSEALSTPRLTLKITGLDGREIVTLKQDKDGAVLPKSKRNYTFSPASNLPNEPLTVTVSAVDQQGTAADKSTQLDRTPLNQAPQQTKDSKKSSSPWRLFAAAMLALVMLGAALALKRRQHITSFAKPPHESTPNPEISPSDATPPEKERVQ